MFLAKWTKDWLSLTAHMLSLRRCLQAFIPIYEEYSCTGRPRSTEIIQTFSPKSNEWAPTFHFGYELKGELLVALLSGCQPPQAMSVNGYRRPCWLRSSRGPQRCFAIQGQVWRRYRLSVCIACASLRMIANAPCTCAGRPWRRALRQPVPHQLGSHLSKTDPNISCKYK